MLREIRIKNLAIIKEVELLLNKNFIILTGETGAGKSIILEGINMLIGEKVSVDMIRTDAEFLSADGVFDMNEEIREMLKEYGIDTEEDELIVKRILEKNGKGKAFINGERIQINTLKEIMENMVDLVGQHSHQMLLNKKNHIILIDKFLEQDGAEIKKELSELYNEIKNLESEIERIEKLKKEIREKKEFYEFAYEEIESVNPEEGEDIELEAEYKKLFNSGKIKENLLSAIQEIKENEFNILGLLSSVKSSVDYISRYDEEYEEIVKKLEEAYYLIEESAYTIENNLSDIDTDENKINEIVFRIEKINKLKKKYGSTVTEILNYKNSIKQKLDMLDDEEFNEKGIFKKKDELYSIYEKKSKNLSQKRRKIAEDVEYNLVEQLKNLNMKGIKFKVNFEEKHGIHKDGTDIIEFLISSNIGEELKPLSKIVSGGEISRIMLSLKAIFAKVDNVSVLIFDEIDTGIGGETVIKVGESLKKISESVQIICISHSPQVAARANQHYYIEKIINETKTETKVKQLSSEERVLEISRMLSGTNITETVRNHAIELLKEG